MAHRAEWPFRAAQKKTQSRYAAILFEVPGVRHKPDVVEIFHPAVANIEHRPSREVSRRSRPHGDMRGSPAPPSAREREISKLRLGINRVAKADIDLHGNPRSSEIARNLTRTPSYSSSSLILMPSTDWRRTEYRHRFFNLAYRSESLPQRRRLRRDPRPSRSRSFVGR